MGSIEKAGARRAGSGEKNRRASLFLYQTSLVARRPAAFDNRRDYERDVRAAMPRTASLRTSRLQTCFAFLLADFRGKERLLAG